MSEQSNPTTPDLTPVAVPDSSGPTVAELEAKIAELESANQAPETAKSVEDEPEAAVFRATTDDTAPADASADPAPAAPATDSAPAPVDSGSVVVASDGAANGVSDDIAAKVDEIHAIAVEVSDFVKNLAPVFEDIQRNGLGSLLGGLFGGRR